MQAPHAYASVGLLLMGGISALPWLVALRVDESLFFANATVRRVLLVCSAVNQIDTTALGVLTELNHSLAKRGITLELAEVKGPVMDRLQHTALGQALQGRVYQSVHAAFSRV